MISSYQIKDLRLKVSNIIACSNFDFYKYLLFSMFSCVKHIFSLHVYYKESNLFDIIDNELNIITIISSVYTLNNILCFTGKNGVLYGDFLHKCSMFVQNRNVIVSILFLLVILN